MKHMAKIEMKRAEQQGEDKVEIDCYIFEWNKPKREDFTRYENCAGHEGIAMWAVNHLKVQLEKI